MHEFCDVRLAELAAEVFTAQADHGSRGRNRLVVAGNILTIASRTFREIGLGLVLVTAWVTSFMPKGSMAPGPEDVMI